MNAKYNLEHLERTTIIAALGETGSIIEAAALLGVTRHSLRRRIIKHRIAWPPDTTVPAPAPTAAAGRKGGASCR